MPDAGSRRNVSQRPRDGMPRPRVSARPCQSRHRDREPGYMMYEF